jgi:catecholate siderophore receptor
MKLKKRLRASSTLFARAASPAYAHGITQSLTGPVELPPASAWLLLGVLAVAQPAQAQAQATPAPAEAGAASQTTLAPVLVRDQREQEGKDSIKVNRSSTAKGNQALRDIPQSITVITEKLIDDRNLDTLKEVLHNSAGVTFQAAEGGEEDIRLRGFSLATTGDIFLDGMRDPAFYERDTFALDRVDVLRGSASMLFGRGSTGGLANQVTKQPHAFGDHEVGVTLGSHKYRRLTGDFNIRTGESSALRINAMTSEADNDGRGNGLDKRGIALAYRAGMGERNEFNVSMSNLENKNPRMNYGLPWVRPTATAAQGENTLWPGVKPNAYYGMASDYNAGTATILTAGHKLRIDQNTELNTQVRRGLYTRDQRASTVRFAAANLQPGGIGAGLNNFGPNTVLTRGNQLKVQEMDVTQLQSDFSTKFNALGFKHELLAGIDVSREAKKVFAQTSTNPSKPNTTVGTPDDGAWFDEGLRTFRVGNEFESKSTSIYAQDTWHLNDRWKLVGGLRYDDMNGKYKAWAANGALTNYEQNIHELSKRLGVLYQPSELTSWHLSYGTSFNTSGDTYSYNATSANTSPEQSRNLELGAKIDSADKRWSTRYAIFYAQKFNERNTDPDTAATSLLLSGKRHSAGVEFDITGRITPKWEVFGSYMWIPSAEVDKAAACPATGNCAQAAGGARAGDRPGLTPKHSGTVWNTYQVTPQWRVGAGLNFRSKQAPADIGNPAQGIYQAPSWHTVDLMAEYRFNDKFTLKANVANVADTYYADTLYRGHYVPGQGRYVQVSLNARF